MTTLNKIKDEVAALGFESDCDTDGFVYALRRALSVAYTERAVIRENTVFSYPDEPYTFVEWIGHAPKEKLSYSTKPGVYAFYAIGQGEFEVMGVHGTVREVFNEPHGRLFFGETPEGFLRFLGDESYTVRSFTLKTGHMPESPEDVLHTEKRKITLSKAFPDFGSVISFCDEGGSPIRGAYVREDVLTLPTSYRGGVRVTYRAAPPCVDINEPDMPLNITRELLHLIPLLTAAYYWLDDDEEKAGYYLSLYREGMNDLNRTSARISATEYTDPRGWA